MNKERRKRLEEAFEKIGEVTDILEEVKKGEEEAYENLPDSIRDGKRGEEMQGYIETLDGICDCLEEAVFWMCQI